MLVDEMNLTPVVSEEEDEYLRRKIESCSSMIQQTLLFKNIASEFPALWDVTQINKIMDLIRLEDPFNINQPNTSAKLQDAYGINNDLNKKSQKNENAYGLRNYKAEKQHNTTRENFSHASTNSLSRQTSSRLRCSKDNNNSASKSKDKLINQNDSRKVLHSQSNKKFANPKLERLDNVMIEKTTIERRWSLNSF